MAEEVVGIIVEKLLDAAIDKAALLLGVRDDVQYIVAQLTMMKAYLRHAEERQDTDPRARTWVKQMQELAYDGEDCIDEFMVHLSQPTAHGLSGALQRCMRRLCTLKARRRIGNQIRDIRSRIERAKEMRSLYDLRETTQEVGTIPARLDPRLSALFVEEAELVGINKPKEMLIQWSTAENEPHLSVISVVGMGGLGKTTLVRKVYESPMLAQPFQCRAWITVSKFQIEDLLRDTILQLHIVPQEEMIKSPMRTEQMIEKLKDHLKYKRYLIVFDDIWTVPTWESIKLALPDSKNGSRVVITTRIETVAMACCCAFHGGHIYKPQPLSHEQSWDLFSNKVFRSPKDSCPPDLKELSDAIIKRCGGLPLAIVAIAGLLASKPNKTRGEWQRVHDRLRFELETNPDLERMKQILNLSYNDLPYNLRHCFVYLSKYPEDYEIERRHVVELWVAEGFARGTHDISADEVAERYFDEFINRSMIQPSKVGCDGKVKSCRVHDMMLEVMVSKSREQNLVSLLDENGTTSLISEQKIRRLSAHTKTRLEPTNLSHVRSITMFGHGEASFLSPRLRLLRILDLKGVVLLGDQQLNWIGKLLVHLRYVNFEEWYGSELPKSWGNLRELETLNAGSRGASLYLTRVTGLQRLRHLRGGFLYLPRRGIGNLKALQTLDTVFCGRRHGRMMKKLGELTQLRRLSLGGVGPENTLHLSTSLAKLNSCLRSLKIHASSTWEEQGLLACLESISPPPLQLQKLALYGRLKKLPSWFASLKDVAKITLGLTELEDDDIKVLQNLCHLIHLTLWNHSYVGEHLCFGREGFQSLRILLLEGLGSMKSLRFEEGAMPNLRRLAINMKPMDWKVECYGIEHLPGLKELHLHLVPKDVADILLQSVETHPNHPRVTLGKLF